MGMMAGIRNSNTRTIQIKDFNGTVVGTISISKPKTSSKARKAKRLQYNFKQISSQIMMSKTSNSASRVVTRARSKVVELLRKRRISDYDDRELEAAIIHAKKMERIARKRVKHLKEEENAKKQGFCTDELEEEGTSYMDELEAENNPELNELSKEDLKQLMQELEELMKKSMDELNELMDEMDLEDLETEIMGGVKEDLEPDDLELLKKKHRADELREIMEADMKYLRALFDKLEKEKQEVSGGSSSSNDLSGISLELGGLEIPAETMPQPVVTEGGNVDLLV